MSFKVVKMALRYYQQEFSDKGSASTCSRVEPCEKPILSVCLDDFVRAQIIHSNTRKAAREEKMIRLENPRKAVLRAISSRDGAMF